MLEESLSLRDPAPLVLGAGGTLPEAGISLVLVFLSSQGLGLFRMKGQVERQVLLPEYPKTSSHMRHFSVQDHQGYEGQKHALCSQNQQSTSAVAHSYCMSTNSSVHDNQCPRRLHVTLPLDVQCSLGALVHQGANACSPGCKCLLVHNVICMTASIPQRECPVAAVAAVCQHRCPHCQLGSQLLCAD